MPDTPLRVHHDAQRVGQAVSNLVGNAVKFTPPGGRVIVSVLPIEGGGLIEVADTGVGIDPDELPRVFERFYRGSRANEARSSGSGLGLAIVKSIIDMHGGTIAVQSRLGAGTRFAVTLPRDPRLVRAPGAPPGQPTVADPAPRPGGTSESGDASDEMVDSSPGGGSRMNPDPAR
jgi:signal transduction histidine kinase